jgi:hypothetical protein
VYADVDIVFDEEELSDSNDIEDVPGNKNHHTKRNDLTLTQRKGVYEALLQSNNNGKLKKDSTTVVTNMFNVSLWTLQRVWHRAKGCRDRGEPVDVSSKKPKHYGKKNKSVDLARIATILLHKRNTIRKLTKELCVNKSWIHKQFKSGRVRRHSNSLKPCLKDENKKERGAFLWWIKVLCQIVPHSLKWIILSTSMKSGSMQLRRVQSFICYQKRIGGPTQDNSK